MNLTIVTGNKGGIGKSFISTMLVDYMLRYNKKFYALDSETSSIQATFAKNLHQYISSDNFKNLNIQTQAQTEELVSDLDAHKNEEGIYIMDTGASSLDKLVENLSFFGDVKKALSIDISLTFLVSPYTDSVVAAKTLLKALRTMQEPLKVNFLIFSATGMVQNDFAFEQDVRLQEVITELSCSKFYLPTIRQDYFDLVMQEHILPSAYIANINTPFGTRLRLESWLKGTFDPIAKDLLDI